MNEEKHHHISDEISNTVKAGLIKAKEIAGEIFGEKCRNREIFGIYALLLDSLHCDHDKKEPWQQ
jgi:hypothetical protein